jgi:hypothetical protein
VTPPPRRAGHGKWQYVREDSLLTLIDAFFATRVFGADRLTHFRRQSSTLGAEFESKNGASGNARAASSARSISESSASLPRSRPVSILSSSASEFAS